MPIRGGLVSIENNLFVVPSEFGDPVAIFDNAPGSIVAFNTFVNTSTVLGSPAAVSCNTVAEITSNIFAFHSTLPVPEGCVAHNSLFDLDADPVEVAGNVAADVATFFRDRNGGDFHLAAASPALGIGEPGIVTVDLEGNPRPAPAKARPDAGAYEAP